MERADLLSRAMGAANLEDPVVREAVEALFESLAAALERGDRVVLPLLAGFSVPWRAVSP
ncbi:MAG: HU family DNA-binding protein [Acidobacteria bacterium]|nr:HU family DNA-binding protein [Acidobacteriota bacterium]